MKLENIDKVHDIVLADRRVIVRELADTVGIPINRVHFILYHELYLYMKKLCWEGDGISFLGRDRNLPY